MEAGSSAVRVGISLPNLALFGAHHRSLLDSGLARSAGGNCAWATTDVAGQNRSDGRMELAEFGLCKDIASTRIGVGIGQAWAQQDWGNDGGAHYNGQYLLSEVDHAFANGMEASLLGYYGRFDTQLNRHYQNGATVAGSKADPDARSIAARARLDWKQVAELASFKLSPYAAYTWMETRLDGYTETGGAFPASYDETTWKTQDLRVGVAGKRTISTAADLILTFEGVHRTDDSVEGVKGQVVGLFSFNLPGESYKQNWARAIVDVDHRFSATSLVNFSLNGATSGDDAVWGVSAGLRHTF
ncbi:MAG: autotransporter outer membrane beta-barrel domain-containing protein [Porticoccaceae bacterium]